LFRKIRLVPEAPLRATPKRHIKSYFALQVIQARECVFILITTAVKKAGARQKHTTGAYGRPTE
jgi:hypothetical protein